jgi:hypothetical protein
MKRMFALAFAVTALAVPAAQAHAASPSSVQLNSLEKQVKKLQAQVKALQKWVPASCTSRSCFSLPTLSNNAAFTYEVEICQQAVLADQFQATWSVIDQISAATQAGKTYFGAQTAIPDKTSCSNVKITRPAIAVTPNAAIFSSLVTLLTT